MLASHATRVTAGATATSACAPVPWAGRALPSPVAAASAAAAPLILAAAAAAAHPPTAAAAASRRRTLVIPSAKKGGSGGGKGQKKGGGALADLMRKKEADAAAASEAAEPGGAGADGGGAADRGASSPAGPATPAQYADPELLMDLLSICQSYWKHTGAYLLEGVELDALAGALYEAPFVCLAHNRFEVEAAQAEAGPGAPAQETVFTYANRAALTLFEGGWDEIVGMPSRLSADDSPEAQADRNRLLEEAASGGAEKGRGIVRNYSGWRRSLKGARFLIQGATLFNVSDLSGELWGQAVVFDEYETVDGRKVKLSAAAAAAAECGGAGGSEGVEGLQALEAAVAEQAAAVRALKDSGKGNSDPEVAAAVEELKRRKEAASALASRLGPSALAAAAAATTSAGGGEGGAPPI